MLGRSFFDDVSSVCPSPKANNGLLPAVYRCGPLLPFAALCSTPMRSSRGWSLACRRSRDPGARSSFGGGLLHELIEGGRPHDMMPQLGPNRTSSLACLVMRGVIQAALMLLARIRSYENVGVRLGKAALNPTSSYAQNGQRFSRKSICRLVVDYQDSYINGVKLSRLPFRCLQPPSASKEQS